MKEFYKYTVAFLIIIIVMTFIMFKSINIGENNNQKEYSLNLIQNDTCWVYEISKKNTLFIRQEFIPAVKNKQVFKSKRDAKIIGNIVIEKLLKNQIPIITIDDIIINNITFNDI